MYVFLAVICIQSQTIIIVLKRFGDFPHLQLVYLKPRKSFSAKATTVYAVLSSLTEDGVKSLKRFQSLLMFWCFYSNEGKTAIFQWSFSKTFR